MESKDLDQLFRDGLEQEFPFHRQEEQWAVIVADLRPGNKSVFWWWYLLVGLLVVGLGIGGWIWTSQQETLPQAESGLANSVTTEAPKVPTEVDQKESSAKLHLKQVIPSTSKPQNQIQHNKAQPSLSLPASGPDQEINVPAFSMVIADSNHLGTAPRLYDEFSNTANDLTYDYRDDASTMFIVEREKSPFSHSNLEALTALPVDIRPLPTQQPEFATQPTILSSRKNSTRILSVSTGMQWQSTLDTAVEESIKAVPYVGISVQLHPRWQGRLRYAKTSIQRNTRQTPATYNIPLVDVPIDFTTPNETDLQYNQQQLEAGVSYKLLSVNKLRGHLLLGGQFSKNSNINTIYTYQNIYQSPVVEASLNNQNWHLSALFTGLNIEIPIIDRLATIASYQYYWNTHSENFRWQNIQQLYFGLNYQF